MAINLISVSDSRDSSAAMAHNHNHGQQQPDYTVVSCSLTSLQSEHYYQMLYVMLLSCSLLLVDQDY